jgi:hypothetical protein
MKPSAVRPTLEISIASPAGKSERYCHRSPVGTLGEAVPAGEAVAEGGGGVSGEGSGPGDAAVGGGTVGGAVETAGVGGLAGATDGTTAAGVPVPVGEESGAGDGVIWQALMRLTADATTTMAASRAGILGMDLQWSIAPRWYAESPPGVVSVAAPTHRKAAGPDRNAYAAIWAAQLERPVLSTRTLSRPVLSR